MPLVNTKDKTISHLVKREFWVENGWCRKVVTVNDAAADFKVGTALGKVTATGKYKVAVETAVDGSEDVVALCLEAKSIPATTDTEVLVLIRGAAIVGKNAVLLDASFDNDTKKQAAYDSLASVDISVEDQL